MKPVTKGASSAKTVTEALGRSSVHPFPARMAPGIALDALANAKRPLRVLDPMMGSGTVLAVARAKGHRAYGVDIDPLAVLLARVWTTAIDPDVVAASARRVLVHARQLAVEAPESFPRSADVETRRFLRYWFNAPVRVEMVALASAIGRVREVAIRDVLWCGLSRLVITKQAGVSRAMDVSHSRPHRVFQFAPVTPFAGFPSAVEAVLKGCLKQSDSTRGPPASIREGDARDLPVTNESIDLVLTSPPYLNAIDYLRCSKFSLVWMGHSIAQLRGVRNKSIGTEASSDAATVDPDVKAIVDALRIRPQLPSRQFGLLCQYVLDMQRGLREVARVLAPGGRAIYVVGDSTVRGAFIRNSEIVKLAGVAAGLTILSTSQRSLPPNRRYLPPPKPGSRDGGLDSRMRREVVVAFERPHRTSR